MSRVVLKAKAVGDTRREEFNFLSLLAAGETISTQTVAAVVYAGVLPVGEVASDILDGTPWDYQTSVFQRVTAGTAGVIYELTCTITTSNSQTLVIKGYLAVLNPTGTDVSLECCPRIGNATSADGQAFTMTFPDRPVTAYADGLQVFAIFDNDATVAVPTINMDLLGAKTIKRSESLGISIYEIQTDDLIHLVFDADANAFIALNLIPTQLLCFAQTDYTQTITTGTKFSIPGMPSCFVISVQAGIATTSSSGIPTFDLNDAGVTMLSTKITVDVSENTSLTAAIPPVISVRNHTGPWTLTGDVDVAGTGAKGYNIQLKIRPT